MQMAHIKGEHRLLSVGLSISQCEWQ